MKECATCRKSITSGHEIHQIDGENYCSRDCAVKSIMDNIIMNAKELAIEHYDEYAVVTEADVCKVCEKRLDKCDTIYAMLGSLFCSKDCGITYLESTPDLNGKYNNVLFDSLAEEVNPHDIGIGGDSDE